MVKSFIAHDQVNIIYIYTFMCVPNFNKKMAMAIYETHVKFTVT